MHVLSDKVGLEEEPVVIDILLLATVCRHEGHEGTRARGHSPRSLSVVASPARTMAMDNRDVQIKPVNRGLALEIISKEEEEEEEKEEKEKDVVAANI